MGPGVWGLLLASRATKAKKLAFFVGCLKRLYTCKSLITMVEDRNPET